MGFLSVLCFKMKGISPLLPTLVFYCVPYFYNGSVIQSYQAHYKLVFI